MGKKITIIGNWVEYIWLFFILLECNSVYSIFLPKAILFGIPILLNILLIIFELLFKNKRVAVLNKVILFLLLYMLLICIGMYNAYNLQSYLMRFGLEFPLLLIYCLIRKNEFRLLVHKMSNIILILAMVSILCWVLVSILRILPLNMSLPITWGDTTSISGFYGIYFEGQQGIIFPRNTGIFPEAPMYNYILSTFFLYEFLIVKKHWIRVAILVITILSTNSTTGLLCIIVAFFMKNFLFNFSFKYNLKTLFKLTLLPIGMFVFFTAANYILQDKKNSSSYEARNSKIEDGVKDWMKSPISGNGFGRNGVGNSNSIVVILSDGGVVQLIFYINALLLIPISYNIKFKKYNKIGFAILFFVVFSITAVMYNYFTLFIIAYWYSISLKKRTRQNIISKL